MAGRKAARNSFLKEYLESIGKAALLTPLEELELAVLIAGGDPVARDQLIKANLRLVIRIARDYQGRGLPLEDLIEEGNLGLMRAAEGFDATYGNRFSTYANYWIKQSMQRALQNQTNPIRLPVHVLELLAKWKQKFNELQEQLGRRPTAKEVGSALGLSKIRMKLVRKASIFTGVQLEQQFFERGRSGNR